MRTALFTAGILCLLLALCPAVNAGIYTKATNGMYSQSGQGIYTASRGMSATSSSYGSMQGSSYSFHVAASNLTGEALNDNAPLAQQPTPSMSGTYSAPAHDPLTYRPRRVIADEDRDEGLLPTETLEDPGIVPIGEVPVLLLVFCAAIVTFLRIRKRQVA